MDFWKLLDKYRFYILGTLIFIIVAGLISFAFLKIQLNSQGQSIKVENALRAEIENLKSSQDSGQVAGISTQDSEVININQASLEELDKLPGIGPAYAQKIIDWRDQNGDFSNIEEIKNIKGIGDKTFEKLKDLISVD